MKDTKKITIPIIYSLAIIMVIGCVLLTISSINKYLNDSGNYNYAVSGLTKEEVIKPVQAEVFNTSIIRPYKSESVSIGRYFYDFEAEASAQENAIILYENTYMQNSGVDYISEKEFDIISVLSGEVIGVETSEILGNIVKIQHEREIISVYQGIDKVSVKVGDTINQGQIIGTSGKSLINNNYATSLHFEVYYKGDLMDPENFYKLNLGEL